MGLRTTGVPGSDYRGNSLGLQGYLAGGQRGGRVLEVRGDGHGSPRREVGSLLLGGGSYYASLLEPCLYQANLLEETALIKQLNVQWFRGGLVFEAHRLLYHSALRLKDLLGPVTRVKKKKKTHEVLN